MTGQHPPALVFAQLARMQAIVSKLDLPCKKQSVRIDVGPASDFAPAALALGVEA
jgi:hypothetical protein